jgi:ArsR family transcriptional regulator, arsenate/arsenite/antimonite-responsive transcriptional repressor / arsenate reductase (thioredoxin)
VYYRLDVGRLRSDLKQLGAGLHPALGPPRGSDVATGSVLFLCSGNSARSQMAEALLRHRTMGRVTSSSAGTHPEGVHPLAIQVLEGRGVSIRDLRSKHWSEIGDRRFDRIVSLCDIARDELPDALLGSNHVHWSLADPAAVGGSAARRNAAFQSAAGEISERIEELLPSMTTGRAA